MIRRRSARSAARDTLAPSVRSQSRADQKPRPRCTGLHDIGGPLHCPGADDDFRQFPRNRRNRSGRRRCSQRDLYQAQPAFQKGVSQRHRVFLALDCQDRDDRDAAEQRMHDFCSGFILSSSSSKFSHRRGPFILTGATPLR